MRGEEQEVTGARVPVRHCDRGQVTCLEPPLPSFPEVGEEQGGEMRSQSLAVHKTKKGKATAWPGHPGATHQALLGFRLGGQKARYRLQFISGLVHRSASCCLTGHPRCLPACQSNPREPQAPAPAISRQRTSGPHTSPCSPKLWSYP